MSKNTVTISPNALLEEAATLMRDNGIGFLPVVETTSLWALSRKAIYLIHLLNCWVFAPGTRLTIEADDKPGIMSNITSIIGSYGANITHIAVYRGSTGKSAIVIWYQLV